MAQQNQKRISIGDFMYSDQIAKAFELKTASQILAQIIEPNLEEMRFKLDDSKVSGLYLAALVEKHVENNAT